MPINGYEGIYEVSNLGRVKSLKRKATSSIRTRMVRERLLAPSINPRGYAIVRLYKNGVRTNFTIARLVATTFIPNPLNKPEIDHIDGTRTNNIVSNLRWVTAKENTNNPVTLKRRAEASKRIDHRNHRALKGSDNPISRKVACLDLKTGIITHYSFMGEAVRSGCCSTSISKCCRGLIKSCKGKQFYYED